MHKFNYNWKLSDGYPAPGIDYHGLKVFSCFACGGGSTMGYKLAGYDVLGCNEIDPKMNECYVANHNPKFNYLEDIREFVKRDDLPQELYELDILDGSPPCSSFSMAGNREKDWGKEKKFKEGQAEQVLDTLFFDFINLAEKLQPKVVVAENVKGLIQGSAKDYMHKIIVAFNEAGYEVEYNLLDASKMGVPQKRERVFFIAMRKDIADTINLPKIDMFHGRPVLGLGFDEPLIPFKNFATDIKEGHMSDSVKKYWIEMGNNYGPLSEVHPTGSFFSEIKLNPNKPINTITAGGTMYHHKHPRRLIDVEFCNGGSYPVDYNFFSTKSYYLIGMSVPPVMTAQIAHRIKEQWFDNMEETR